MFCKSTKNYWVMKVSNQNAQHSLHAAEQLLSEVHFLALCQNLLCGVRAEVTESPEGRGIVECVVSVPNEYLGQIPQTKDYLRQLRAITPSVTSK